ncbi:nuclear transport factor 2 family protein [Niveispirillum fermenti]|uniref:nuclear transport factor 2 family protein n=1 Tax=Niveispirillum fermenti TaxID=1233113 RepID=UPI003A8C7C65
MGFRHKIAAGTAVFFLSATAGAGGLPEGPALNRMVETLDADFFALFFQGCDPDRLATMLTPDFEMYHDKDGEVARSAAPFVASYAQRCATRQAPDAWRSRRELIPGSMTVHPIGTIGVLEQGEHFFYERRGDGPETKVGRARFTQLWRLEADGWKLARIFSYDHEPVK